MKLFAERFLDMVRKYPQNRAVSDESGSLTYSQLYELSEAIADQIRRICDPNGEPGNIAVIYPRKKEVLAAFLGVLFSGNAYVFSVPDAPSDRMNYVLQDAEVRCIITAKDTCQTFSADRDYPVILADEIAESAAHGPAAGSPQASCNAADASGTAVREYHFDPDSPAFITYTSGSTGNPKGVVDTFLYIENHVNTRHSYYTPGPEECIGNIVSFTYAASTYDLFSGITQGSDLYIFSEEELLSQSTLIRKIVDHNISSMFMIPSMLPVVFGTGEKLPIRCIITAGEKAKKIPELSAQLVEIYGSSEAAAVLGRVAKPGDPWDLLGKPVEDTRLFLINEQGEQITEPDTTGELCIVNSALALGYLNRREETDRKFRACPFLAGHRMFVSGDMMRFDAEGNYYYCGRKDNLVKINGQRAEMGEIEAAIAKYPGIEDVVCTVRHRNHKDMLVCYYIAEEDSIPEKELSAFTAGKLPGYMVPLYWIRLDHFPKNANGKTDRKLLPEPDYDAFSEKEAPKDPTEKRILEIARQMLPDIEFGVTDNLMRLGMDSVTAVQFVTKLEQTDSRITVSDVMRYQSIRAILQAPKQTAWYHKEYDDQKPVIVLIHGIVPVSGLSLVCEELSRACNVLVIEPFTDHIMRIIGAYDYEKLVDYYCGLILRSVPKEAELWGFAGYSFGGQIALSTAAKYYEKTGIRKKVLMGDTFVRWVYPDKKYPVITEDDPYIRMVQERSKRYGDAVVNEPLEVLMKKQNCVVSLINSMKENRKYDGKVYYLDAKLDYDEEVEKIKMTFVKMLYSDLEIREFNILHNDLYLKKEVLDSYLDLLLPPGGMIK